MGAEPHPTSSHWGNYQVIVDQGRVVGVRPDPDDPAPAPIMDNVPAAQHHKTRVARPSVRRRWLEHGPGPDPHRGSPEDEYVEVEWGTALDLLARELDRVRAEHGNQAIYGGSYGWGSAGRVHHAQTLVHRFLNSIGGYTRSRTSYSHGAIETLFPRILGAPSVHALLHRAPSWKQIQEHTELLVTFGGLRLSNTWNASGGRAAQTAGPAMQGASDAGVQYVSLSPLRDDMPDHVKAEWVPVRPGTDTAVMLALMYVLFTEDLADTGFLDRCTEGADVVRSYVLGGRDERGDRPGLARTPEWAEHVSGVPADELRSLARQMAKKRTLVNVGWSVQRSRYGEQPLWAGVALACCLGQIGLPGAGFACGYGSVGAYGGGSTPLGLPRMPQGQNPVSEFIPVTGISDALLDPGGIYQYDGQERQFPDLRLVYWAGGNPFHHHQDLKRLTRAFGRADTVVFNETHWTASARHADIVLPATTTLERNDIAASQGDLSVRAMARAVEPYGQARDEYDTFTALAERLGAGERFTKGRTSAEWMRHIYEEWRETLARNGIEVVPFDTFWAEGRVEMPGRVEDAALFAEFRADPEGNALPTPSGRIELFSSTIDSFELEDCPGHPVWLAGPAVADRKGEYPLVLVANQPSGRLHGQQDMGAHSMSQKVRGRAPLRLGPVDAAAHGVADGDVVRVSSAQGSCLAGAVVSDAVSEGVMQLSTGAWYDPSSPEADCVHGNPNVLTEDVGTSAFGQGCTGQLLRVRLERFAGPEDRLPPVRAFDPPVGVAAGG